MNARTFRQVTLPMILCFSTVIIVGVALVYNISILI